MELDPDLLKVYEEYLNQVRFSHCECVHVVGGVTVDVHLNTPSAPLSEKQAFEEKCTAGV